MRPYVNRVSMQVAAVATGNGTAIDTTGYATLTMQITGITSATITFEATIDGSTWVAIPTANDATGASATTATANGIYTLSCAGYAQVRARISTWASGTINVTGIAVAASSSTAPAASGSGLTDTTFTGRFSAGAALADATALPTTTQVGAALEGYNGATLDLVRVQTFRVDLSAVAIGSIATVWTPTSGKKFRLMGGSISVSAACNVLFEDNSAGAGNFVWRTPKLLADTPYSFDLGNGKLSAAANNVLKATSSASASITGTLYGVEE